MNGTGRHLILDGNDGGRKVCEEKDSWAAQPVHAAVSADGTDGFCRVAQNECSRHEKECDGSDG